jgi:hypothetical protein
VVTIAKAGSGLALPLHILEVLFSNFEPETVCPDRDFPKFPPYLQANSWRELQKK